MTSEDIAWMAGLFEGEGCMWAAIKKGKPDAEYPSQRKDGATFSATIHMVDEDVIARFHSLAGFGALNYMDTPSGKKAGQQPTWRWTGSGKKAIDLMFKLAPYFGIRRRAQMMNAICKVSETNA